MEFFEFDGRRLKAIKNPARPDSQSEAESSARSGAESRDSSVTPPPMTGDWLTGLLDDEAGPTILGEPLFRLRFHDTPEGQRSKTLLAVDREGRLVLVTASTKPIDVADVNRIAGLAWEMRTLGYTVFDEMARGPAGDSGDSTARHLAEAHKDFFSLAEPLAADDFNASQRLLFVSTAFSAPVARRLAWLASFEIDSKALEISLREAGPGGKRVLSVREVELLSGGRLLAAARMLAGAPADLFKRASGYLGGTAGATEPEGTAGAAGTAGAGGMAGAAEAEHAAYPSAGASFARSATKALTRVGLSWKIVARLACGAMVAIYALTFGYLTLLQHRQFGTFGFDLGIFDQGLWLLSQGKTPFVTIVGLNLFGDHSSYIMLLLVPLYWIWEDVRTLLILQTVVLALGAVPVYLLARNTLKSLPLSLAFAFSYLMYPALEWLNRDHFHPEALATTALLFAFYFATRKRYWAFGLFAGLAALAKEDVAPVIVLLGLYVAWKHQRRAGLTVAAVAALWFLLNVRVLLPYWNGRGLFRTAYFSHLGDSFTQMVATVLFKPWYVATFIFTKPKLLYLLQIFAPLGFLPLLSPGALAIALPAFLSNLLSTQGYMDKVIFHYVALIIPIVFASSILAVGKLRLNPGSARVFAIVIAVVAIVSNQYISPSPISQNYRVGYWALVNDRADAMSEALDFIPKDAVVSAHYRFVPHLSHREKIYEFPNPFRTVNWGIAGERPHDPDLVEYVVVDVQGFSEYKAIVGLLEETNFERIFDREEVVVLKRR